MRFYWKFYVHVHFPNIRDFIDKGLAELYTSEKLPLDQDFLFVLVEFAVASIFSYSTTITIASSHFLTFSIFLNTNHHYDKPKSNNCFILITGQKFRENDKKEAEKERSSRRADNIVIWWKRWTWKQGTQQKNWECEKVWRCGCDYCRVWKNAKKCEEKHYRNRKQARLDPGKIWGAIYLCGFDKTTCNKQIDYKPLKNLFKLISKYAKSPKTSIWIFYIKLVCKTCANAFKYELFYFSCSWNVSKLIEIFYNYEDFLCSWFRL